MTINRVRKGVPTAGQFAASEHSEPSLVVTGDGAGFPDIGEASVDDVRALARSSDPLIRAEATSSPRVPDDVLEELSDPSQPVAVRLSAVNTGYAGTADRAAADPHPVVRAAALAGWDLSETNRTRLGRDTSVMKVMGMLAR